MEVNETIQEVVTLTQNELRKNQVILRMELAPDLPSLMGDRVQLQQVIVNLILNSIEAMRTMGDRERNMMAISVLLRSRARPSW